MSEGTGRAVQHANEERGFEGRSELRVDPQRGPLTSWSASLKICTFFSGDRRDRPYVQQLLFPECDHIEVQLEHFS